MPTHLIPLSTSLDYHREVAAFGASHPAVTAVHLSHLLCHHADELMRDPRRAEHNRAVAALYREAGLEVWAWTHEVHHPPEDLLDATGRLRVDDPGLRRWLEEKYATFFQETLPGLTGLVLTFAETQFAVYQDDKVVSGRPPGERTLELIHILREICHRHGVRLVVRDFVYRLSEVEQMRATLAAMPADVGVMSKIVPHDWHPYYPLNPLLGVFPGREQWVEHDLGHEYEGQHLYPFADLPVLRERIDAVKAMGCAIQCLRLDRYHGDAGQSALFTPWGQRELASALAWNEGQEPPSLSPEENELLDESALVVKHMLFPARMWLADHSALPHYAYAVNHLVEGNADRLPIWTEDPADKEVENGFRSMSEPLCKRLAQEMEEAGAALQQCRGLLASHASLAAYGPGIASLETWFALWSAYRKAFFALRVLEERGEGSAGQVSGAIDSLETLAISSAEALEDAWLEIGLATQGRGAPKDQSIPFGSKIQSLRDRLGQTISA